MSTEMNRFSGRWPLLLVVLAAVVAGVFAGLLVYDVAVDDSEEYVAVVELHGTIDAITAQTVEDELREARQNDSIEAVVLEIDSGGGLPAESERMHAAVERTAAEMPVMAAVDTSGASGAYLAMVPADTIYVAPSTQLIGSVGVIGPPPAPLAPDEGATGPNKGGNHPDQERLESQVLAELFLESVMEHRADEIELSREEVAEANAYIGTEAVDNGFADELGFLDDAIADAADAAGLDAYEVVTERVDPGDDPFGIPLIQTADGDIVVANGDGTLTSDLHLAIAPEMVTHIDHLDLAVYAGDDVEMVDDVETVDDAATVDDNEARNDTTENSSPESSDSTGETGIGGEAP